ncbi:hypothetical protein LCGC14_1965140, partial [marine sediment metagenome]
IEKARREQGTTMRFTRRPILFSIAIAVICSVRLAQPAYAAEQDKKSEVKQLLRKELTRQKIAQAMIDESSNGNVPMIKELLDRTEGKVQGDQPPATNVNVVFVIGKGYPDAIE